MRATLRQRRPPRPIRPASRSPTGGVDGRLAAGRLARTAGSSELVVVLDREPRSSRGKVARPMAELLQRWHSSKDTPRGRTYWTFVQRAGRRTGRLKSRGGVADFHEKNRRC